MQNMAMETYKETQKINESCEQPLRKKKKASGSNTMNFLKEKAEMEMKFSNSLTIH